MCGIIGEISRQGTNVTGDIYSRLSQLQHRGQEAAGIYVSDPHTGVLHERKGQGLVNVVFQDGELLSKFDGTMALGHVRYSTTLDKDVAQPFSTSFGEIMLAHNGQVANEPQLRAQLDRKNRSCKTGCDAEVLLRVFEYYFDDRRGETVERVFRSVEKLMQVTTGAYSVVAGINGEGLLAFRDPHGIRPLVYGRSEDRYVFASETVALDGLQDVQTVKLGEAIFVDNDLNVSKRIISQGQPAHCFFEWDYFAHVDSDIEGIYVHSVRKRLGIELAHEFEKNARTRLESHVLSLRQSYPNIEVLVSPVPETARPAAESFARETGFNHRAFLIKDRYSNRTFIQPTQQKREAGVKKIRVLSQVIRGNIALIKDDSIVRGTSSRELVQAVRDAGAVGVYWGSTCPPIKFPCPCGIDFHTTEELIAANRSEEEVGRIIGADVLTYNTLDGLVAAIGKRKDQLCLGCLTGEYPASLEMEVEL
ncbi:MAG: amidophosphoribosyltransferase [Candidatus Pacearchaeota archaeon]|nr:amidophosphoribosyltransferase [Candidatus Pacearchaeota archaeon]